MRHRVDEFQKLPIHLLGNEQVLGLTHHGSDTTEGRAYGAVHNEAADKCSKPLERLFAQVSPSL